MMKRFTRILTIAITYPLLSLKSPADTQAVIDITAPIPKGETQVWSPLFQASWDKLNTMHKGRIEKIVPQNKLMVNLDNFRWQEEKVMPKGAYAIFAGPSTREFAVDTAMKMKKQFDIEMNPNELPISPLGNAVYGALARDVEFQKHFYAPKNRTLLFKDRLLKVHQVKFFGTAGTHSDQFKEAVKVLDYKNKGKEFILSIATKHADERLIIYLPSSSNEMSFSKAMKHVQAVTKAPLNGKRGSTNDPGLHSKDIVKIPYVAMDFKTDFVNQLKGTRYYRGDPSPWRITGAYQVTQFELFEKGAKIRVHTHSADGPFGSPSAVPPQIKFIPRYFICDRPFFIFLWRDKANIPYLATFIDSSDTLTTFSNK